MEKIEFEGKVECERIEITYPMNLPAVPAIYLVRLPCGEVCYIGKASSLRGRWSFQSMSKPFHHIFPEAWANRCTLSWLDCTGTKDKERKEIERCLIKMLRPRWNRTGNNEFYKGKRRVAEWAIACNPGRLVQAKNRECIFREHPRIASQKAASQARAFKSLRF